MKCHAVCAGRRIKTAARLNMYSLAAVFIVDDLPFWGTFGGAGVRCDL